MAEIILTTVINKAIQIAANPIVNEASRLSSLGENINWIVREMRRVKSYLADAEAKKANKNEGAANFIQDVEEIGMDIEDMLDSFLPKFQQDKKGGIISYLKNSASKVRHGHSAHKFALEIEEIKRRVADLDRARTTYGIIDTVGGSTSREYSWDTRRTFLNADDSYVVGQEKDCNTLVALLLGKSLQNDYGAISIVGMPGLGKTTLGKQIYKRVQSHFQCSALVYVSEEPRVQDLLLDIAKQVGLPEDKRERENLQINLSSFLKDKRYVLLLDDIWNTNTWDALKVAIPRNHENGSRIIVTSRSSEVGRYIGGESSLHKLNPLNKENSQRLFANLIMPLSHRNSENRIDGYPDLEDLGNTIVEKCGGVPLAIAMTAGILRGRERTVTEWNFVLRSMMKGGEDDCLKIIGLSYEDLPSELKPCFLYFGLFPEDFEIPTFDLIKMWVAENFIRCTSGELEREEVGEHYLNNLISRNLILVGKKKIDGTIKTVQVHDLLRSFCIAKAKESNFFFTLNDMRDVTYASRARRLSTYSSNDYFGAFVGTDSQTNPKLRALLFFEESDYKGLNKLQMRIVCRFRFLRVLRFGVVSMKDLPSEIGDLIHLVYLKLSGHIFAKHKPFIMNYKTMLLDEIIKLHGLVGRVGHLPSSIINLKNLETLDVSDWKWVDVPSCIFKMEQLRHLLLNRYVNIACPRVVPLPNIQTIEGISNLAFHKVGLYEFRNLKTLVVVYDVNLVEDGKIIEILSGKNPSISNKLEKLCLKSVEAQSFDELNLSGYHCLRQLYLGKVANGKLPSFPPNLTSLTLKVAILGGDVDVEDPMKTLEKLPHLKFLKLVFCESRGYCHIQPILSCSGADSFPQLEVLKLEQVKYMVPINLQVDKAAMPKLKKLIVVHHKRVIPIVPERLIPITTMIEKIINFKDPEGRVWLDTTTAQTITREIRDMIYNT